LPPHRFPEFATLVLTRLGYGPPSDRAGIFKPPDCALHSTEDCGGRLGRSATDGKEETTDGDRRR
jgi:hypothetical protein